VPATSFLFRVVDARTGRGISHVRLTSDNGIVCYTHADGSVAWTEDSLMDRDVHLGVESASVETGLTVRVTRGGRTELAIRR
jgi:hypothetical protein